MTEELMALAADHVITVIWLKATLLMSMLLLARIAVRRWSASSRAALWTVAVSALVLLPLGHYAAPQAGPLLLDFPVFLYRQSAGDLAGVTDSGGSASWFTWALRQPLALWIAVIWPAGTAALLLRLAWQTRQLSQLAAAAEPCPAESSARIAVAISAAVESPLTFGWRHPRILLPVDASGWAPAVRTAVLAHERAHVERHDYAALMLAEIAKAVYWMNPLAWRLASVLRAELECACDDAVLRAGMAPRDYVRHLLDMALRHSRLPGHVALPMARRSLFRARVTAILDHGIDRRVASVRDVSAAAVISFLLMSALAGAGLWSCPDSSTAVTAPSRLAIAQP